MATNPSINPLAALSGQPEKAGFIPQKAFWHSIRSARRYKVVPVKHTYKLLAKGTDKRVVKADHLGKRMVAYAPVTKLGGIYSKESTLKKEYQKILAIKSQVPDATHLALDMTRLTDHDRIDNKFSLVTEEACCSLEAGLRDPSSSFARRLNYCVQYLDGLQNLHSVNVAHGDIKPENCLLYDDDLLKIADFGKAQMLCADGHKTYKGNLRFCPPEGLLSTKGDVYASALLIVRVLEETAGILDEQGVLVPVPARERGSDHGKGRGIEKYVVEHGRFLAIDSQSLRGNITRRLPRQVKLTHQSRAQKVRQRTLIVQYIEALSGKLVQKKSLSQSSAEQLVRLLKDMTRANPNDRITSAEAFKRMVAIEQQCSRQG